MQLNFFMHSHIHASQSILFFSGYTQISVIPNPVQRRAVMHLRLFGNCHKSLNLTLCLTIVSACCYSHLHAGAGWTGVGAVSNGGMVEPGQGVNGTVLTNQAGMSTAGYHTH